jgi:hypothetical protein
MKTISAIAALTIITCTFLGLLAVDTICGTIERVAAKTESRDGSGMLFVIPNPDSGDLEIQPPSRKPKLKA